MHTNCSSLYERLPDRDPLWTETPLDRKTPPEVTWDQAARQEVRSDIIQGPPLWTDQLTHACENITLPQTYELNAKHSKDLLRLRSINE